MAFDRSSIKWGSLYVTIGGKLVTKKVSELTDDQLRDALRMAANANALADGWQRLSNGQIARTPATSTTNHAQKAAEQQEATQAQQHAEAIPGGGVATAAGPVAPTGPIDPRDSGYQTQVGQAAFDRDTALAEQNARLGTLPSLYNRANTDIGTAYNRGRYDSNADLAARGIVRSGEYQRRGTDMATAKARQMADVEQQYGSGARSQIAASIANINQQYALTQASALQAAKDRYAQAYPASSYVWNQ